ncbi:MAG: tRNA (adenosine(37)-N6)-dimethylallyltransferase MiaA, partial [Campylobacterota bacterium]
SKAGIQVAKAVDAVILSLDSLSVYKKIDIASAKPGREERGGIVHFGIDELYPDESFNAALFIRLYDKARNYAKAHGKNLIILGGTGFYLHTLTHGISRLPVIKAKAAAKTKEVLKDVDRAYETLLQIDPKTGIEKNDRFRIEKALQLYYQTGLTRSQYFAKHPPQPVIKEQIPIFEIDTDKALLHERIAKRTQQMFEAGIVAEVSALLHEYGREPNCFKAIGIKEIIGYIDGQYDLQQARELVTVHTRQLAKRQRTFNRSKFPQRRSLELSQVSREAIRAFAN